MLGHTSFQLAVVAAYSRQSSFGHCSLAALMFHRSVELNQLFLEFRGACSSFGLQMMQLLGERACLFLGVK